MRVYFAPCGIGLGHVGRIMPIARELRKERVEVVFSTYRDGIRYVEHEKFPLMKAPPIGFQVKPDGSIDFRQTAVNPGPFFASFTLLEQVNAEVKFIESFKPNIVVSDSRISSLLAARLLGIPRICILNQFQLIVPRRKHLLHLARFADSIALTLVGKMWTSGNTVLIPDFPPPYTISAGNLNIPKSYRKNVRLIGPILEVRPPELDSEDKLRKKLELPVDKPVIFVPISGPIKEKAFLTGLIRKTLLEFPKDYEIIMSLGYPDDNSRPVRYGNVTIYKWIPNRFEYLKACDVVVARAGHGTITQAMCYGKPIILVPTPSHTEQINNAKQASDLGVAGILLQENLNKQELLKSVKQALDGKTKEKLQRIQQEVLRYDGAKEVVRTITQMAQE
jgi:UDP-N-acetylglucosamine--N-acetylmuramyl-(pentapeptide) pyrophosphoryl-undecaprenol N-acetylglucosamine transferase